MDLEVFIFLDFSPHTFGEKLCEDIFMAVVILIHTAKIELANNDTKVTNMQNAHVNSYSDKAISPAIPFGGSARHFTASAANTTNYYIQFTPPRLLYAL